MLKFQRRACTTRSGLAIAAGITLAAPVAAALPHPLLDNVSAIAQAADRARAEQCLATAIAYEAGYESIAGKQAVAEVILNRARSGAYPKTVCGVIFAGSARRTGCQFTFNCDGSLRRPMPRKVMAAALEVAVAALEGRNPSRAAGATHYHADYVFPYWAPSLRRVAKLGAHIFYRPRDASAAPGEAGYVARGEPAIAALSKISLAATGTAPPDAASPSAASSAAGGPFAPWGLAVDVEVVQP